MSKHGLTHAVLLRTSDADLSTMLAKTLELRAALRGRRRMGSKSLDGQRYDSQIAGIRREIKRRKREARMQDLAA